MTKFFDHFSQQWLVLGIPRGRLERIKAEEPPVAQPDRWACAMPSDGHVPASKDGWMAPDGKCCPVPPHTLIQVRYRSEATAPWVHRRTEGAAGSWEGCWIHDGHPADIVSYRVIPQGAQS